MGNDIGIMKNQMKDAKTLFQQQQFNKKDFPSKTLVILSDCTSKMQVLSKEIETTMVEYVSSQTAHLEKKEDLQISAFSRVERALNHVKMDLDNVAEEQKKIELAIESDTKDLLTEKKELDVQKGAMEKEMEELERMLAKKKQEISQVSKKLNKAEEKIEQVKANHERKLKHVKRKKSSILSEQEESQTEYKKLEEQKKQLELETQQKEEKEKEYQNQLKRTTR